MNARTVPATPMARTSCDRLARVKMVDNDRPDEYRHSTLLHHELSSNRKKAGTPIPSMTMILIRFDTPVATLGMAARKKTSACTTHRAMKTAHIAWRTFFAKRL